MHYRRQGLAIFLALSIPPSLGLALDNNPEPKVARVNYCGSFDRQFFLDHRDPQWGDTLTTQLSRATSAKCHQLEAMGTLSYSPPSTAFLAGRALGTFSDGLNHNDPYNNGGFDGYDNAGNLTYSLTGANFACIERIEGTINTVAPSLPCPPFSDTTPGGNGATSGGVNNGPGGINLVNLTEAVGHLIKLNPFPGSSPTPIGTTPNLGHQFLQLAAYQLHVKDVSGTSATLHAAMNYFNQIQRLEPFNMNNLKLSATALVGLGRLARGDDKSNYYRQAKKRLRIVEDHTRGLGAYNLACIMALEKRPAQARKWLGRAQRNGFLPDAASIKGDDDLASLRSQRWFRRFLTRASAQES